MKEWFYADADTAAAAAGAGTWIVPKVSPSPSISVHARILDDPKDKRSIPEFPMDCGWRGRSGLLYLSLGLPSCETKVR